MSGPLMAAVVGLVAGTLSGAFGIGGGVVTTPAIRLLLGYPELVAVGTPLLVIIPTAVAGAVSYGRARLLDVRLGLWVGAWGALTAAMGAWFASLVGGRVVLLITAGLIAYVAGDMLWSAGRKRIAPAPEASPRRPSRAGTAALGLVAGLYSGFLGLGGGLIIVPGLYRIFGLPVKRAIGTSLLVVAIMAVPGTIAHATFGHVDIRLALMLVLGVVPGAVLGARLTTLASDRHVQLWFGVFLALVAAWLGFSEAGLL